MFNIKEMKKNKKHALTVRLLIDMHILFSFNPQTINNIFYTL